MYNINMIIEWNEEKNRILKDTRAISFELVKEELEDGRFVGPEENPGHPGQMRVIVSIDGYPYAVPFVVMENGGWFLKTVYPCRKLKGRI
jgi:uncharacterized DUF497 family protein